MDGSIRGPVAALLRDIRKFRLSFSSSLPHLFLHLLCFLPFSCPFCSLLHLSPHLPFPPPLLPSFSGVIICSCRSQASILQQEEDNTSSGGLTRSQGEGKAGRREGQERRMEGRKMRRREGQEEQSVRKEKEEERRDVCKATICVCKSQEIRRESYYPFTPLFNCVYLHYEAG